MGTRFRDVQMPIDGGGPQRAGKFLFPPVISCCYGHETASSKPRYRCDFMSSRSPSGEGNVAWNPIQAAKDQTSFLLSIDFPSWVLLREYGIIAKRWRRGRLTFPGRAGHGRERAERDCIVDGFRSRSKVRPHIMSFEIERDAGTASSLFGAEMQLASRPPTSPTGSRSYSRSGDKLQLNCRVRILRDSIVVEMSIAVEVQNPRMLSQRRLSAAQHKHKSRANFMRFGLPIRRTRL